jgi:nucleotide-binding universal stress UspA family protein
MSPVILAAVVGVLGGGLAGGIGSLLTGRALVRKAASEAKAIDAKLPAEVDSVVVAGAEAAVLVMDKALTSATLRIAQLEEEAEAHRQRIRDLELKVGDLEVKATKAETAAREAREQGRELRQQLQAMVREQGPRR